MVKTEQESEIKFMRLVPGQVIHLMHGAGLPSVEAPEGSDAVIAFAEATFAVTSTGRILTTNDLNLIVVGQDPRILAETEYRVSGTAIKIHDDLTRGIELPYRGDEVQETR